MSRQLLILILLFLFVAAPGVRAAECANCCLSSSASTEAAGCCAGKEKGTKKSGHQENCKRCFTQLTASNDQVRPSVELIFSAPVLDIFFPGALLAFHSKSHFTVEFKARGTAPNAKQKTAILRC
ncbi:MAG: hypothetical protein ACKVS6_11395 [Planctomycetota bacterium]